MTGNSPSEELVARLRLALTSRTWVTLPEDIRDAANTIERLESELEGYRAWARSVNEALNTGDGSYRP